MHTVNTEMLFMRTWAIFCVVCCIKLTSRKPCVTIVRSPKTQKTTVRLIRLKIPIAELCHVTRVLPTERLSVRRAQFGALLRASQLWQHSGLVADKFCHFPPNLTLPKHHTHAPINSTESKNLSTNGSVLDRRSEGISTIAPDSIKPKNSDSAPLLPGRKNPKKKGGGSIQKSKNPKFDSCRSKSRALCGKLVKFENSCRLNSAQRFIRKMECAQCSDVLSPTLFWASRRIKKRRRFPRPNFHSKLHHLTKSSAYKAPPKMLKHQSFTAVQKSVTHLRKYERKVSSHGTVSGHALSIFSSRKFRAASLFFSERIKSCVLCTRPRLRRPKVPKNWSLKWPPPSTSLPLSLQFPRRAPRWIKQEQEFLQWTGRYFSGPDDLAMDNRDRGRGDNARIRWTGPGGHITWRKKAFTQVSGMSWNRKIHENFDFCVIFPWHEIEFA